MMNYCSCCQEKVVEAICPMCEEPTMDYDTYCEQAYERQCSDHYGGSTISLRERQIEAWAIKHG